MARPLPKMNAPALRKKRNSASSVGTAMTGMMPPARGIGSPSVDALRRQDHPENATIAQVTPPGSSLRLIVQGQELRDYTLGHAELVNKGRHRLFTGGSHDAFLSLPVAEMTR
jgi:hypothetical protein